MPTNRAAVLNQKFTSDALSGGDGAFTSPPVFNVKFGSKHSMVGLTFDFGDEPPAEFTVVTYDGTTVLNTYVINKDITAVYQAELLIENASAIDIIFNKTRQPYSRVRLNNLLFGIGYQFENATILHIKESHTGSPIGLSLPQSTLNFDLYNEDDRFSIDSSSALIRFLMEGQDITVEYGLDVSGTGSIEWVPSAGWRLSSWDVDGITVSFTAVDVMDKLTQTNYEKSEYDYAWHFPKTEIKKVLEDAGITDYYIDSSLSGYYLRPIPIVTHAEAAQILSNLAMATLRVDKEGRVCAEAAVEKSAPSYSSTELTPYSTLSTIGASDNSNYATFESDYMRLDGSQLLVPSSGSPVNNGATFQLSKADGTFGTRQRCTINYGSTRNVYNIQFDFGGQIPKKMTIWGYSNGEWDQMKNIYPTKNVDNFTIGFIDVSSLWIECMAMPAGERRFHLNRVDVNRVSDFTLAKNQILGNPKGSIKPSCKTITQPFYYTSHYPSVFVDLYKESDVPTNQGWMRIEHDWGLNITASVDNTAVTIEQKNYAYVSYIKLTSAADIKVTLTISGKKKYEVIYPGVREVEPRGEVCEMSNPLVQSGPPIDAKLYFDWLETHLRKRREYVYETRGYPELELFDFIFLDDGSTAQVVGIKQEFSGSLKSTLTLRK